MKNFLFISLFALAFSASAATVTIDETTSDRVDAIFLNTGISNVDTSTNLEWLSFTSLIDGVETNVTMGHSINSAVDAYGVDNGDWRLATYTEITDLFTLFFPTFVDSGDGTMALVDSEATANDPLNQERNSWLMSFGTAINQPLGDLESLGFYLDEQSAVQEMGVDLFTNPLTSNIYGLNYAEWDTTRDQAFTNRGVFMVRDFAVVPVPAAVWLFGSGLLGLAFVARRKKN